VMYAGEVVETAPAGELFAQQLHPYSNGLMRSNPHFAEPGHRLAALPGRVPSPSEWPVGCHFANRCPLATDACRTAPIPMQRVADSRSSRCIRVEQIEEIDVR